MRFPVGKAYFRLRRSKVRLPEGKAHFPEYASTWIGPGPRVSRPGHLQAGPTCRLPLHLSPVLPSKQRRAAGRGRRRGWHRGSPAGCGALARLRSRPRHRGEGGCAACRGEGRRPGSVRRSFRAGAAPTRGFWRGVAESEASGGLVVWGGRKGEEGGARLGRIWEEAGGGQESPASNGGPPAWNWDGGRELGEEGGCWVPLELSGVC